LFLHTSNDEKKIWMSVLISLVTGYSIRSLIQKEKPSEQAGRFKDHHQYHLNHTGELKENGNEICQILTQKKNRI